MLWRKDFGAEAALGSVRVDPRDARRAILTGDRGTLSVLRLTAPERGRVEVRPGAPSLGQRLEAPACFGRLRLLRRLAGTGRGSGACTCGALRADETGAAAL